MKIQDNSNNDRLTTVRFKLLPVIDDAASKAAKKVVTKEIEVCEISFSGRNDVLGVYPAHEIIGYETTTHEWGTTSEPVTYAIKYNAQYMAFKEGQNFEDGTPLSELGLTQSKTLELKGLKIFTIEALAAIDGSGIKKLGMGGREFKNKAQAYLDAIEKGVAPAKESPAPVSKPASIAEELATYSNEDLFNLLSDADKKTTLSASSSRDDLIAALEKIMSAKPKKAA